MVTYPEREPTKFLHFLESRLSREASERVLNLLHGRFNGDTSGHILHLYGAPVTGKTTLANCLYNAYPLNVLWGVPVTHSSVVHNKIIILDGVLRTTDFKSIENLKSKGYLVIILDLEPTVLDVDYSFMMDYTESFYDGITQEKKDIRRTITG